MMKSQIYKGVDTCYFPLANLSIGKCQVASVHSNSDRPQSTMRAKSIPKNKKNFKKAFIRKAELKKNT